MANMMLCVRVRFSGKDIEPAIKLEGIGIDNLSVKLLRQINSDGSFADRGRADDEESVFH